MTGFALLITNYPQCCRWQDYLPPCRLTFYKNLTKQTAHWNQLEMLPVTLLPEELMGFLLIPLLHQMDLCDPLELPLRQIYHREIAHSYEYSSYTMSLELWWILELSQLLTNLISNPVHLISNLFLQSFAHANKLSAGKPENKVTDINNLILLARKG